MSHHLFYCFSMLLHELNDRPASSVHCPPIPSHPHCYPCCGTWHPSPYRTRRWTWSRSTSVSTACWTTTWPTSSCRASPSRSLPWTLAACSPASPWTPCPRGTTSHTGAARLCPSPPSCRRALGKGGHWAALLAGACLCPWAAPPCRPSAANTGPPTGVSSDRAPSRRPCQCPTNQCQGDPSQKPLNPATGRPSEHPWVGPQPQTVDSAAQEERPRATRKQTCCRHVEIKHGHKKMILLQGRKNYDRQQRQFYVHICKYWKRVTHKKCILIILKKLTLKNLYKSIKKWLFEWLCKFCSKWIKVTILCGCFLSAKFKDVFFSNGHLPECKRSHDEKYSLSHLTISETLKGNYLFDMKK